MIRIHKKYASIIPNTTKVLFKPVLNRACHSYTYYFVGNRWVGQLVLNGPYEVIYNGWEDIIQNKDFYAILPAEKSPR